MLQIMNGALQRGGEPLAWLNRVLPGIGGSGRLPRRAIAESTTGAPPFLSRRPLHHRRGVELLPRHAAGGPAGRGRRRAAAAAGRRALSSRARALAGCLPCTPTYTILSPQPVTLINRQPRVWPRRQSPEHPRSRAPLYSEGRTGGPAAAAGAAPSSRPCFAMPPWCRRGTSTSWRPRHAAPSCPHTSRRTSAGSSRRRSRSRRPWFRMHLEPPSGCRHVVQGDRPMPLQHRRSGQEHASHATPLGSHTTRTHLNSRPQLGQGSYSASSASSDPEDSSAADEGGGPCRGRPWLAWGGRAKTFLEQAGVQSGSPCHRPEQRVQHTSSAAHGLAQHQSQTHGRVEGRAFCIGGRVCLGHSRGALGDVSGSLGGAAGGCAACHHLKTCGQGVDLIEEEPPTGQG